MADGGGGTSFIMNVDIPGTPLSSPAALFHVFLAIKGGKETEDTICHAPLPSRSVISSFLSSYSRHSLEKWK